MRSIPKSMAAAVAVSLATAALAVPMMSPAGAVGSTPTTTKLSASPNAPVAGQTVKFSAKIVPGIAGTVPTGTVTFTVDLIGQAPIIVTPSTKTPGDGVATISETWTSVGPHAVSAHYNGNGTYAPSTSLTVFVTVGREPTTVAVTSSLTPSVLGQAIKLYAKIGMKYKNAVPTGTVTFTIDGVAQGPTPITIGTTHATLRISTLTHGNHDVTAHYNGDSAHLASTSAIFVQTVN